MGIQEGAGMKFICSNCVDSGIQKKPCTLKLPNEIKKSGREDWEMALRRCPFEDTRTDHKGIQFTGVIPMADWRRKK
jgi:hypothetical protein